ncbi:MAG: crosslink repair DNA glycosylase YcaQ family protein [Pseudomonadota bacterium]
MASRSSTARSKTDVSGAAAMPEDLFHPCTRQWFTEAFASPTRVQLQSWPSLFREESALLLAPTGSGKTLAAFLAAIDRLVFPREDGAAAPRAGVKVLYISPLKALGVDVDRNLRAPLAGISAVAAREGIAHREVSVAIRSGDTESRERSRMLRHPPDLLITTPESLYLMLTSKARDILASVETVIIDEIHTMVSTKRGAHLFLSLERLERLTRDGAPAPQAIQRIGLSATQRPLEEVARLLGGYEEDADDARPSERPVNIIDASEKRPFELTICMPLGDQIDKTADEFNVVGNAATSPVPASIWPAIYPRLVSLIREHRSTMVFVNSRRLAERLAAAINDTAEEDLARAHHGSMSKDTRADVEDRLKRGDLRALVATSSMELGIDMGAVDLVIQVEAPPSIASGLQRIGRAGHGVGEISKGIVFPKYRGDLLSAAAASKEMLTGHVEASAYPRNPLDVLAQQIVAMVAIEDFEVDDLYRTVRGAAPFADLPRSSFDEVLNLLSGRYPSDDFAGLRARITWDRINDRLTPRRGAQRTAILNAGTIPDRGLYGVFLLTGGDSKSRVGELDEEMVFELQAGEVFRLGASMWRALEISKDQVLVEPAPGEQGKMPFWRGDGVGRPLEFGRAIGKLTRSLSRAPRKDALRQLTDEHALEAEAAEILYEYVQDQFEVAGEVPSDEHILIESFVDEVGDWRVVLQSPFGARVHAPWAMTAAAQLRERCGEIDVVWCDDGIVFRLPESDAPPQAEWFLPDPESVEEDVIRALTDTSMFAARFRENAARALLLPRRFPGQRTPLWLQRRKSADLMSAASRFPKFPMILETYRECLSDVFDLAGLTEILEALRSRRIRVHEFVSDSASPFAQTVLFDFTASFIYDADAPLAERRAQVLSLDHAQLKELLGSADYRELLDAEAIAAVALKCQRLDRPFLKDADDVHDLLLALGDLDGGELADRALPEFREALAEALDGLVEQRRVLEVRIAGTPRYIAVEDAARYRDALGTVLPMGIPAVLLEPAEAPLRNLLSRYLRSHGPFLIQDVAARFGAGVDTVRGVLNELAAAGRALEGGFTPGGAEREWVDADVLKLIKRRSLAGWRQQIEAVDHRQFAAFVCDWQAVSKRRRGVDGLFEAIEQLQGVPLPASVLESEILPARVEGYREGQINELFVAGDVLWRGLESIGSQDGRIALYLTENYPLLAPPAAAIEAELPLRIHEFLKANPAPFFDDIVAGIGGFPNDVLEALWDLVWSGHVGNDSLAPLRARLGVRAERRGSRSGSRAGSRRGRRSPTRSSYARAPRLPGSEGRWTLFDRAIWEEPSPEEARTAQVQQLLERYGILVKEALSREGVSGGFAAIYPVLKAMEEAGRLRRGYFVEGLGASQFAVPGAEDRLRAPAESDAALVLAATDPANAYGHLLPWPEREIGRCARVAGARVIVHQGALVAFINKGGDQVTTFLGEDEPERGNAVAMLIDGLRRLARGRRNLHIARFDGEERAEERLHRALIEAGFQHGYRGYSYKSDVVDLRA